MQDVDDEFKVQAVDFYISTIRQDMGKCHSFKLVDRMDHVDRRLGSNGRTY